MNSNANVDSDNSVLAKRRVRIKGRSHALRIAHALNFCDLLKYGGSVEGFANWLFYNRDTFNGERPLQQANVYVNSFKHARVQGRDLDAEYRKRIADLDLAITERMAIFQRTLDRLRDSWSESWFGATCTFTIIELCFGRGSRFAMTPNGDAICDQPSYVLEWLADFLEWIYGVNDPKYSAQSGELGFRRCISKHERALQRIHAKIFSGRSISEEDLRCVTDFALHLALLPRVRGALKVLINQAKMLECIEREQPIGCPPLALPSRRDRHV